MSSHGKIGKLNRAKVISYLSLIKKVCILIQTVGDSHSWYGWKDITQFPVRINHVGPKLMYTFSQSPTSTVSPSVYQGLSDNDILIHCFGEIDCRCHISKHVTKTRDYKTVISELTSIYIMSVLNMKNNFLSSDASLAVYSIVPPIRASQGINNPAHPFLGSDEERLQYHKFANECLKSLCENSNLIFFDVTKEYEDNEGYLILEKSDRICHINEPTGIVNTALFMNLVR